MKKLKVILIIIFVLGQIQFGNGQIIEPVKWSYGAKKISTLIAVLYFKAEVKTGWHIYSVNQPEGGPVKTTITFFKLRDFVLSGKTTEPKPIKKFEEAFGIDVLFFTESVIFQQKIKLRAKQTTVKAKSNTWLAPIKSVYQQTKLILA